MNSKSLFNLEFLLGSRETSVFLPALTAGLIVAANFCVFLVVPDEQVMGAVQRIFYFHVGSAFATYLMLAVVFISGVCYLQKREVAWDALGEAGATVGFVFASAVLLSGMIWGNSAWNTWWRWEPRLVSFLVLWLILLSLILLRAFTDDPAKMRNFAAVLGIVAAVNVPIVIYSVKLLDHTQQLHPQVVANQGLRDASYVQTLLLTSIAVLVLSFWMMLQKLANVLLRHSIERLDLEVKER